MRLDSKDNSPTSIVSCAVLVNWMPGSFTNEIDNLVSKPAARGVDDEVRKAGHSSPGPEWEVLQVLQVARLGSAARLGCKGDDSRRKLIALYAGGMLQKGL